MSSLTQCIEEFRAHEASRRTAQELEWQVIRPCWKDLTRIATFMSYQGSLAELVDDPDLMLSFVLEATWELLCGTKPSVAMPADIPSSDFIPIMRRRVAQMASAYVEAHPRHAIAGMAGVQRRRQALSAHSRRLARTLGYDPEIDDAIESYNTRIRQTRKDPERSGALITPENIRGMIVNLSDDLTTIDNPEPAPTDEAARNEVDLRALSAQIQRQCDDRGSLVGQVAFELLDLAASGEGAPHATQIARLLGADRLEVQSAIAAVQEITMQTLDLAVSRFSPEPPTA